MDPMPKVVGEGWELWVEDGRNGWDFSGTEWKIYDMVNDAFPSRRLVDEYDEKHIITWGTRFGPLYEDVLEFLHKWGVKAKGVNIPPRGGERGVFDETAPD